MGKHKENSFWPVCKPDKYPNIYISTADKDNIEIMLFGSANKTGISFTITRRFAKMLARRINQCLDATKRGERWHVNLFVTGAAKKNQRNIMDTIGSSRHRGTNVLIKMGFKQRVPVSV